MQQSINERLKILITGLNISARAFSAQLQVPESNTRNYLDKNTKLNSDYLERIATHFKSVNLSWLITGEGEPFISSANENDPKHPHNQKFFRSPIIGTNQGTANQQQNIQSNSELDTVKNQLALAEKEIDNLRAQLEMKDVVIAAKDQTINLLSASFNRPN